MIHLKKFKKELFKLREVADSNCNGCYFHSNREATCSIPTTSRKSLKCSFVKSIGNPSAVNYDYETTYYIWEKVNTLNKKIKVI